MRRASPEERASGSSFGPPRDDLAQADCALSNGSPSVGAPPDSSRKKRPREAQGAVGGAFAGRKVQAAINVTPLVDVVLVLLIIFMVVAPQLQAGPAIDLPTTAEPPQKTNDGRQVRVALEYGGAISIDDDAVAPDAFAEAMQAVAADRADWKVVLKGDARLSFGEVRQAMLAVEAAGFKDVGLIAERRDEGGRDAE